jgi:glycosyltransferase involved in cell wall biosynthesis
VLPDTSARLLAVLDELVSSDKIAALSRVYFVDDGSTDKSWACIVAAKEHDPRIVGIKLSRNCGHQNALLAGLLTATEDMVVSIDADLQDDVSVIGQMVDICNSGKDIVFGIRDDRSADSWLKRTTAEAFYCVLRWLGVNVIFNHADFRLMTRRSLEVLRDYGEVNVFLRGIVPMIGLPSATVSYQRKSRLAGKTKYSFRRMLSLAANGITSFSVAPLRLIAALGIAVFFGSLILTIWVAWVRLFSPDVVPGWASSVLPMYFLGGVQLLSIGILGEYVSKIYMETKRRPRFVIEAITQLRSPLQAEGSQQAVSPAPALLDNGR